MKDLQERMWDWREKNAPDDDPGDIDWIPFIEEEIASAKEEERNRIVSALSAALPRGYSDCEALVTTLQQFLREEGAKL